MMWTYASLFMGGVVSVGQLPGCTRNKHDSALLLKLKARNLRADHHYHHARTTKQ